MQNDAAYANTIHIPGGADYPDRWAIAARQWRELASALGRARLNQPYGPHGRERYDLFYPASRPEGLVVLIHGGYWMECGREDFSHLARGVTEAGWACALPSYPLAPEATVPDITRSVARAVDAAAARISGPVALTGHSAGGQLALRLLEADVPLAVRSRLSACAPVSPLGDLRPLIETGMNGVLRLDAQTALSESPALRPGRPPVPVTLTVGSDERPAFLAQARQLAAALEGSALDILPGRHHFDVIEAWEDPESRLVAALTRTDRG